MEVISISLLHPIRQLSPAPVALKSVGPPGERLPAARSFRLVIGASASAVAVALKRVRRVAASASQVESPKVEGLLKTLDTCVEYALQADIEAQPQEVVADLEGKALKVVEEDLKEELPGFGGGTQLPKKVYTLQQMLENGVDASKLLSPQDTTQDTIRTSLLAAVTLLGIVLIFTLHPTSSQLSQASIAFFAALAADAFLNNGALDLVVVDSIARAIDSGYKDRVHRHEAGHFLVAYLVGVLPKAYTLSSWDAVSRFESARIQAGCVFCDSLIQREVQSGKISGKSIDKLVCIAFAGVAAEFLKFGDVKGGRSDIGEVDRLFQALGFDEQRAAAQVRWAVLNVVNLLKQHEAVHDKLIAKMESGATVSECLVAVEEGLHLRSDAAA